MKIRFVSAEEGKNAFDTVGIDFSDAPSSAAKTSYAIIAILRKSSDLDEYFIALPSVFSASISLPPAKGKFQNYDYFKWESSPPMANWLDSIKTEELAIILSPKNENFAPVPEEQSLASRLNNFIKSDPLQPVKNICLDGRKICLFYSSEDYDLEIFIARGSGQKLMEMIKSNL